MSIKLKLIAFTAVGLLALGGCSQKSAEQAPPPPSEQTTSAEPPSAEAPPADLSATAPEGESQSREFAGELIAPPGAVTPPEPEPEAGPPPPSHEDKSRADDLAKDAGSGRATGGDYPTYESNAAPPPKTAPSVITRNPTAPLPTPAPGAASGTVMSKKVDGTTVVKVYFATDRKIEVKNNVRRFTGDEVNGLYYGTVDVSIPPLHQVGAVESPQWWKMEFTADPAKHVVYQGFDLLNRDAFYSSLSGLINKGAEKEAFIFVHGFNTPFEEAARRTAQIEYDLKFDGAPIFYSWPSQGSLSPLAYNRDAVSSDRTVPRLKFFLQEVAKRTGAKRIHLIAHSMGNKAMVNALVRVADEMTAADKPLFNQIVLTAPDIDREVFQDLAQRMRKAGAQVTLYASKNDKALQASKLYSGFPRAGDATGIPVTLPGIFTIDASAVTTDYFGLNHDFFADKKTVLSDLGKLLATGTPPDGRKLRKVKAPDGSFYWVID